MARLILPTSVTTGRELAHAREEFAAQLREELRPALGKIAELDALLKRIDPLLHLVYWDTDRPDLPFRRGYWYVIRDNPGGIPSWVEINADGAPIEPTSRIFDRLAQGGLWNADTVRRSKAAELERLAQAEADRLRADEERTEHLRELVLAATRTQVSMNRSTPWAQNHAGHARVRGTP